MASSFLASAHERALDAAALSASSPPPPLQLPADLIRLVACACRGPEALRWCAVCREHHACRPPLRFLIIDDYPAIEMHSGPARVALAFNRSRLPRPNADWVEAASCEASGRATESSLSGMSAVMACEGAGGDALRLHLRPADGCVHCLVGRMGAVHACEVTHLSLQTFSNLEEGVQAVSTRHGALLTSLRVVEVLHAEVALHGCGGMLQQADRFGVCNEVCSEGSFRAMARRRLLENTAATVRTLSLLDTTPSLNVQSELVPLLRLLGPRLHYLSLLAVPCLAHASRGVCYLEPREESLRPADGLDADLSSYEAEMETEMLRNAADGLCIALLEPARALAHAADAGAPPVHARGVVDLAAVAARGARVRAALAEPHWLR
mmetsp:Transcript_2356/g.6955  ORF Transcript_2356/g.6955 Transcript_2356/m.6955 type:complete len:380 (+) Transcript_2356:247-1386(+)